ncbi:TPA: hypothetical protein ACGO9X_002085 [Streptococcus suis]
MLDGQTRDLVLDFALGFTSDYRCLGRWLRHFKSFIWQKEMMSLNIAKSYNLS